MSWSFPPPPGASLVASVPAQSGGVGSVEGLWAISTTRCHQRQVRTRSLSTPVYCPRFSKIGRFPGHSPGFGRLKTLENLPAQVRKVSIES
eukprot:scaffold10462_cov65-Cylindrotheca_fusiformis.AAC.1